MRTLVTILALTLVLAGGVAGWSLSVLIGGRGAERMAVAPASGPPPVPLEVTEEERSTIELFRAARDSVVSISTADRVTNPWTRRSVERAVASGSGFLWDEAGHVVTNNHVIENAGSATVALADGRTFDAELVGRDRTHDLAVLQISGEGLPDPLPRGRSRTLEVGQKVLAIGNPFGLDWTLTTGIVSALDRELPAERSGRTIRGLIQTDAAINPGNSGGPLLDAAGELIGVNAAIFSPSGASAGIGFAVPMATVARVVPQLVEHGHYSPPTLGLQTDARVNAAVNRQGLSGVLVLGVDPGSPAAEKELTPARLDRSGRILPGDVVTAVDGTPVETLDDYLSAIDLRSTGEAVELTVERDGRRRTLSLELAAAD